MARIRTIKPSFFRHAKLFDAEKETGLPLRVAYAGLWTSADREGRFKWEPRELKLDCLPFDEVDFSRVLDALTTRGFIEKYEVDGREYGFIPSWKDHQIINNRESDSNLPEPTENNVVSTREPRVEDACVTREKGKGREGKGKEGKDKTSDKESDDIGFEEFYKKYPRHEGMGQAEKAYACAIKIASKDELLAGLDRALEIWRDTPKKFIPLPATWLNGKRWQDELESWATGKPYRVEDDPAYRGVTW